MLPQATNGKDPFYNAKVRRVHSEYVLLSPWTFLHIQYIDSRAARLKSGRDASRELIGKSLLLWWSLWTEWATFNHWQFHSPGSCQQKRRCKNHSGQSWPIPDIFTQSVYADFMCSQIHAPTTGVGVLLDRAKTKGKGCLESVLYVTITCNTISSY